jgi:hypothetical protein
MVQPSAATTDFRSAPEKLGTSQTQFGGIDLTSVDRLKNRAVRL